MIKRWLGIDFVDFVIQAAITALVAAMFASLFGQNDEIAVAATFAASFGLLAWRRHKARVRGELGTPAPASGEYVAELEQRVADLEAGQQRIYELEERLDFAERLLAQQRSAERISEGQ
jgi:hypothetical protein